MDKMISWGIIGCGNVTEVKSGPAFNKVPNSKLHAVMRRDAAKAEDYAKRHGVPVWYNDANDLINDPEVNAIYIATPPKYHEAYAKAALEKGKHVYIEKPVTLNVAELDRLIELEKISAAKIVVAHYRRALPMFKRVKELVEQNILGRIQLIQLEMFQPHETNLIASSESFWRVDPSISGGGLFYDLAPHQLDIMVHVFGNPVMMSGTARNHGRHYTAEDAVAGIMGLPNGIMFQGSWHFNMPGAVKSDRCKIIGEKGFIEFPFFGNQITIHLDGTQSLEIFEHPQHIQQPMIQQVVEHFLDQSANPCSLHDARESLRVMEQFVYGK